jgi:hypothetical protein
VPTTPCLLSPNTHHITTERVRLMTFAKHVAIGGRYRQRSRRHLADPQVGRQYGARVRNVSPRSKGGSSSSI